MKTTITIDTEKVVSSSLKFLASNGAAVVPDGVTVHHEQVHHLAPTAAAEAVLKSRAAEAKVVEVLLRNRSKLGFTGSQGGLTSPGTPVAAGSVHLSEHPMPTAKIDYDLHNRLGLGTGGWMKRQLSGGDLAWAMAGHYDKVQDAEFKALLAVERSPHSPTAAKTVAAKALYDAGFPLKAIGDALNVSRAHALRLVNGGGQ